MRDLSIAYNPLPTRPTMNTILPIKWHCLYETCMEDGRSSVIGFGSFRTASVLHPSPTATTNSNHGSKFQTTETSG